jgi:hypothetical protein
VIHASGDTFATAGGVIALAAGDIAATVAQLK